MDAQTIIVIAVISVCAAYLLRRWTRLWLGKSSTTCHGCDACTTTADHPDTHEPHG